MCTIATLSLAVKRNFLNSKVGRLTSSFLYPIKLEHIINQLFNMKILLEYYGWIIFISLAICFIFKYKRLRVIILLLALVNIYNIIQNLKGKKEVIMADKKVSEV